MKKKLLLTFILSLLLLVPFYVAFADLKEWKKIELPLEQAVPTIASIEDLPKVFADPAVCGGCHPTQFKEWSQSYHGRSVANAGFQILYKGFLAFLKTDDAKKLLGRDARPSDLRQCLWCHAPAVQFMSDALIEKVSDAIAAGKWEEIKGVQVSCPVCHNMTTDGKFLGNFTLLGTLLGPIRDPVEAAAPHKSRFSETFAKSDFCATCHSVGKFNVYCSGIYEQWKGTKAAKDGIQCQNCHMKESRGTAATQGPERAIHSHLFPGGRFKEMWKEAIEMALQLEKGTDEVIALVSLKSRVPHNMPDG